MALTPVNIEMQVTGTTTEAVGALPRLLVIDFGSADSPAVVQVTMGAQDVDGHWRTDATRTPDVITGQNAIDFISALESAEVNSQPLFQTLLALISG